MFICGLCKLSNYHQVAGEQEVKAQIKLKFRDVTGNPIVVTRTLVSQEKVS